MPAPLPVVGVMPPGVRFLPDPGNASEPNYDVDAPVDFWLAGRTERERPKQRGWNVVSRLQPGASAAQASADVAAISARLAKTDPDLEGLTATAQPLMAVLNVEGRRLLLPLFGSVALVFLIACGNVSGLLLARGLRRQQEYAVRSALGRPVGATVPPGADRERHAGDDRWRARRCSGGSARGAVQGDWRSRRAAGGCGDASDGRSSRQA